MIEVSIVAAGALLGIGYVVGRLVGAARIPHVIAGMTLSQIADLGEQVEALRPTMEEMSQ